MADKKISEFPSGVPSNQAVMLQYELASERGGANYKLTLQDVMNLIGPNASTSPFSPYTFPQFSATTATISSLNVSGTTSLSNPINTGGGVGSAGQVLFSRGAGLAPIWGNVMPVGGIIMWSGAIANIPTGWQLCDGTNGTPNLKNKFIICADADTSGVATTSITGTTTSTGGTKDAVIVQHNHGITEPNGGTGHAHDAVTYNGGTNLYGWVPYGGAGAIQSGGFGGGSNRWYTDTINVQKHTTDITINNTGDSGINQNLPPYYALAYIMRLAY